MMVKKIGRKKKRKKRKKIKVAEYLNELMWISRIHTLGDRIHQAQGYDTKHWLPSFFFFNLDK